MTGGFDFDKYSRNFKDDDFLRQTMRTIKGQPVSTEQLNFVRERISNGLSLESQDHILDLCCGNGHLAQPFISKVERYLGVDAAENLIRIASTNFSERRMQRLCVKMLIFLFNLANEEIFTKMLWYGFVSILKMKGYFNSESTSSEMSCVNAFRKSARPR